MIVVLFIVIGIFLYYICKNKYTTYSRISRTEDLPENYEGIKLRGFVTGISDGDGFRFFHCPLFRSPECTYQDEKLYVRLAGIDAPEMGHINMRQQPFAVESKQYLKSLVLGKEIDIKVVGKDQYNRVLAFAYLPGWFSVTNVNLEMVKNGYACVYTGREAKYDEYFGDLMREEIKAKTERRGMWMFPDSDTPMKYKRIHRQ